jgi:hypothetical protein
MCMTSQAICKHTDIQIVVLIESLISGAVTLELQRNARSVPCCKLVAMRGEPRHRSDASINPCCSKFLLVEEVSMPVASGCFAEAGIVLEHTE